MGLQFEAFLVNPQNFIKPDRLVSFGLDHRLSAGLFAPATAPTSVLIFYHGGGAHMAGYGGLAHRIRRASPTVVITPDIRGHGKSAGQRGYAPRPELIWFDVDATIDWAEEHYPGLPIILGGHSSGAGMLLNWASRKFKGTKGSPAPKPTDRIAAMVLLAPWLTKPKAKGKTTKKAFATVRDWVFTVFSLSGGRYCARTPAVRLGYPLEVARASNLLLSYTAGMALALTPKNPRAELKAITCPLLILAAAQDEMFPPDSLRTITGDARMEPVEGSHLTCLIPAAGPITRFIGTFTPPLPAVAPSTVG